jgi:hypothetical protein
MTPAIKILRPKAELKPKKNSFITMRTQIARDGLVADITAYVLQFNLSKKKQAQRQIFLLKI